MSTSRRSTPFWFGIAATLAVWVAMAAYWTTHRYVRSLDTVNQSHEALEKLQAIQALTESAESSATSYAISGVSQRLAPFYSARTQIPKKLRQLDTLVAAHPEQRKMLKRLNRLLQSHLAYLGRVIEVRQEEGADSAARWIAAEDDSSPRQAIERLLQDVQKMESSEVRARSTSSSQRSTAAKGLLRGAAMFTVLFMIWAFTLLRRENRDRKRAETSSERLETFLRLIFERIPYMITVKEATNLRLTMVNKAAAEWFGKSESDLIGCNEFDLRPKEDARAAMDGDRQVLQGGAPIDIPEERFAMAGHEDRILHTQKIVIFGNFGVPAFLVTISEDITQRKQAERMLELSRDTAVESARLKAEFLRNMSHELRTPLSIIIGMTSLLLDTELAGDQKRFASTVKKAADGLSLLTKDILDFSKIETGSLALETEEVDVRHVVESVAGMLSEQAKAKGVSIVSLVSNDLPTAVLGDGPRLRQVLTQLLGNAVKFTAKGEIIVRASEARQDDSTLWITYQINDTGIGIEDEAQKHLFEPFRQGDGSHTRRYGGTGLGLAMAKRLIELMGGEIGFKSKAGEGSCFWFTLPFKKRHLQGPVVKVPSLPWTRSRVMVVDESATVRQWMRQQLSGWGLASEGLASGEGALDLLRREARAGRPFPIVILDLHLPDMDGAHFVRQLRADPSIAHAQVLVMSTDVSMLEPATAAPLGFAGAIAKPLQAEALFKGLTALIEKPNQGVNLQEAA